MLIYDMHCHLDLIPNFQSFISEHKSDDLKVLAVTTTPRAYEKEVNYCRKNNNIKVALGLHPQLVKDRGHEIEVFRRYVISAKYIGEIGLDFSKQYYASKENQMKIFREIVRLCSIHSGKVISIHSLRSEKYVLDILGEYYCASKNKCILHWYTGSNAQLKRAIEMGCFFSINQRMLNTDKGKSIIHQIPSDRILLESDMPFVVDACNPNNLFKSLENIGLEISKFKKDCTLKRIEENAKNVFGA